MRPSRGEVTQLLTELAKGNQDAANELAPLVYAELHELATRCLQRERRGHTLQTTVLVHEAYLKLVNQHRANWQSRAQFFLVASQVMRRILVDYARGRLRQKRGGGQIRLSLEEVELLSADRIEELIALDETLTRLQKLDARQSQIVELRVFGGLTGDEIAAVLGISAKTVKRDWSMAKAWLFGELRARHGDKPGKLAKSQRAV